MIQPRPPEERPDGTLRETDAAPRPARTRSRTGGSSTSRCPTCGARRTERSVCHRCRTDLASLVAVEEAAGRLHDAALGAYAAGRFRTARDLAATAARLLAAPRTLRLLACAALRAGDFLGARAAVRAARDASAALLLLVLVALFAAGCGLAQNTNGTPLDPALTESIEPGRTTRDEVLDILGPPEALESNPREEVLLYRYGLFRGTDFSLKTLLQSFPGLSFIASAAGVFQQAFEFAAVDDSSPAEFPERDPLSRIIPMVMRRLAGSFNLTGDLSTHQVLDLRNRQVRYDTIRIVVDRATGVVREKSFDNAATGDRSWVRATLLQE